jgi:hypothetical protein
MWALAFASCVFSDAGDIWIGDQESYAVNMPRPYCDLVQSCPNLPADFDERECRRELEAYLSDMPCYSNSAAIECMTVGLNVGSGDYVDCESYWTFPQDALCLRAAWQSESCDPD